MKQSLIVILFATLCSFSTSSYAEWKLLGQRDLYRVVLIDESHLNSTNTYWNAIHQICKGTYCNVFFVRTEDAIEIESTKRLSEDDFDKALLIYSTNRGFQWNCNFRPSADNCFKWK